MWGDSTVCFVYIQGDWSNIPSRPTYPAETAATLGRQSRDFQSRLEAAGASRGFSKGERKKKREGKNSAAAVHTTLGQDPRVEFLKGLLFWIEEKSGIEGRNG